MTGGQNRAAIFQGNTYYFGPAIGGEFELIADGSCQHIPGRHMTRRTRCTHCFNSRIFGAVHDSTPVTVVKFVAHNAVQGRGRTRVNSRVTGAGVGGRVMVMVVAGVESLVHQPPKAALCIFVVIAVQIVIPHLVDYDANDQFGAVWKGSRWGSCFSDYTTGLSLRCECN